MPHAGGGGHSGGGHSSSSARSVPRYDHSGRLHSNYYIRPGFYHCGRFVPYTSKERKGIAYYAECILLFVLGVLFIGVSISVPFFKGVYIESKLEDYAFSEYEKAFDDKEYKYYESNVLVTFVTYEDKKTYDYFCINGDLLDIYTDTAFGDFDSTFGKSLVRNIPEDNYIDNLYTYLANSLNEVTATLSETTSADLQAKNSNIVNKTSYNFQNGKAELESAMDNFYNKKGYNITFVVTDNYEAYKINWVLFGALIVFGGICTFLAFALLKTKKQDVKYVENAINQGKAKELYEGEDPFEEYYKNHPLN